MERFRVPQRKVAASITLSDGRELEGAFYVPAGAPDHGPGSVDDRLENGGDSFLPFAVAGGGRLVNRDSIVIVRLERDPESAEADASGQRAEIRLRLFDGGELSGAVHYVMPPERGRLMDFLNAAPRFVRVERGGETVLVNRGFVVEVCQLDGAE